jgi:hypothetical protein
MPRVVSWHDAGSSGWLRRIAAFDVIRDVVSPAGHVLVVGCWCCVRAVGVITPVSVANDFETVMLDILVGLWIGRGGPWYTVLMCAAGGMFPFPTKDLSAALDCWLMLYDASPIACPHS